MNEFIEPTFRVGDLKPNRDYFLKEQFEQYIRSNPSEKPISEQVAFYAGFIRAWELWDGAVDNLRKDLTGG